MMSATGPWLVMRIEHLAESEWAVVECEAAGRTVVTVEVALAIANANPIRHQRRESAEKFARK